MMQQPDGRRTERIREPRSLVSVLIVGPSYGDRNVLAYICSKCLNRRDYLMEQGISYHTYVECLNRRTILFS